ALSVAAWRCGPFLLERSASGPDCVKRIGLAARAALPPQPADLEHLLALLGEEAVQAGAERAGSLDRERTPTRCVLSGDTQSFRVAAAIGGHARLDNHHSAAH